MRRLLLCVLVCSTASAATPVRAAFPGEAGLIAFGHEEQIYTVDPNEDDPPVQITTEGENRSPAWSPDGARLAWACDGDICIADADGSNRTSLMTTLDREQQPEWSPDGEWIVFSRQEPIPDSINYSEPHLYKVEVADPDNVVQVTDFVAADPEWSPDGRRIVFARGDIFGGEGIWSIRPDGSGPKELVTRFGQNAQPDWSPLGDRIVFLGKRRNRWRVVFATRRGRIVRELEPNHCCALGVSWSPNGGRIAFVRGAERSLFVASLKGGHKRGIAEDARSPDWQRLK